VGRRTRSLVDSDVYREKGHVVCTLERAQIAGSVNHGRWNADVSRCGDRGLDQGGCPSLWPTQHILPFRMAVDLRFCERTKRNNRDPFASRILDRLAHHLLSDLAATQGCWDFCVVDYDNSLACATISHLGFDAIDDHPVASLGRAIRPFNLFVGR
jgi:hypothetical protein